MKSFIVKFLFISGLFLAITSCTGMRTTTSKNSDTKTTELNEKNTDKTADTKTNREINENFGVPVRTNDEAVNKAVRDALRDFNFSKQSGTNSTQIIFDEEAMAFKIANIIGETQDKNTSSVSETKSEKTFEQTTDEYFSKKVSQIPWWLWLIVAIYFMPRIVEGVTSIINPLSLVVKKFSNK
jgi:hypothetical protein